MRLLAQERQPQEFPPSPRCRNGSKYRGHPKIRNRSSDLVPRAGIGQCDNIAPSVRLHAKPDVVDLNRRGPEFVASAANDEDGPIDPLYRNLEEGELTTVKGPCRIGSP